MMVAEFCNHFTINFTPCKQAEEGRKKSESYR